MKNKHAKQMIADTLFNSKFGMINYHELTDRQANLLDSCWCNLFGLGAFTAYGGYGVIVSLTANQLKGIE